MNELKLLLKDRQKYAIHYSCSGFYDGGTVAPTICCIAMTNIDTKEVHSFALHNNLIQGKSLIEAENQLLLDFVNFVKSLNNPYIVNWDMTGTIYGFKAIFARCENFGIYDFDFTKLETYNLKDVFEDSLIGIFELNKCLPTAFLSGKEEAHYFDKRNFSLVKLSTEGKSLGIAKLFEKYLNDDIEIDTRIYDED